ncbi:CRACD-like protein isoform X1 [Manacus candei]|uniref:CRACD-like protein isoform X1 n=1 Tax=Manacus candei TaxID=415023 RepID=UPI0022274817|nr:CRACD-like protein isoform X1 [Manacus candei]XP_051662772.1 CRACD-like protein isoform X1 [Manacus candei]XP_051662773.1 CRACD-like protein isoform X1 [Manacus candei]XP_051662775.1 CRACD-like protein isoform X1 [Manacus candei]
MSSSRIMDPKMREAEGDGEDNSGKKKSKFKSFKKFFGKKKRKETPSSARSNLKLCQSASDVAASHDMRINYDSEDELEAHKGIMGSRALSHDSIFILETGQEPARPVRVFSQENISDRIRALQLKLQPTMKLGPPPPFGLHAKRTEDAGTSSEDDGLPRSPPEMSLLHESLNSGTRTRFFDSHKHLSSLSLAGTGSEEEEQVTLHPSRVCATDGQLFTRHGSGSLQTSDSTVSPTANFDTPPELSTFLDNSAAKHKLLIKPRNQRSSKMRRFSQRTQSESLTDLSCTPEEEEEDDAVFKPSNQELPWTAAATQDAVSWPKPRMPEDLPPALRPVMTQPASEPAAVQGALLPDNKPQDCQLVLETTREESESSLLIENKEPATSSYSSPDRKVKRQEDSSETLVLLSGDVSDMSINILNRENKEHPTVFPVNKIPSKENIPTSKNSVVLLGRSDENIQKDDQVPVEMSCSEEAKKEFTLLSESSKEFFVGSSQPTDSFHVSHPASSVWMGSSTSCSLEKIKTAQEAAASGKNSQSLVHKEELLGNKAEKVDSELNAFRKFSVSSARERPRTRSLHFPERSELESPLNTGFFLSKEKVSSRNEKWKEDFQKGSELDEEKRSNKKQTSLAESDSENTEPTEILAGYVSLAVDAVLMPSNSSVVSQNQPSCKDKSPFQVKLRSTSLSLKHKDNSSPESKEIKRYSAEFNLENEGLTSFLKGDKAEIKKPANTNTGDSLNEKIKPKAKSSEQLSSKPPLPKKPALQNITIPNTTANKEKQDKSMHSPKSRSEDKDLEKQSNSGKVPEKSVPSPVATGDSGRDPGIPAEPAWISIARQKQRGMQQEKDREKLVAPDMKSDTEKKNKEKEQTEGSAKQQRSKTSYLAAKSASEEQRKDTKSEEKEPLLRTNSLSHYVPVAPSPALVDKEEIGHLKKASNAAPDEPSWMELAKKKSQAWSDMPQIIK